MRRIGSALLLAIAAVSLAGCGGPSLYQAVLADPGPRDDAPMTPDQVKQATETLIADRQRLCAEAAVATNDQPSPETLAKCSTNQTP